MEVLDKRILIVDDEVEILGLLETVLKKEGFVNIFKADTGKNAIEIFAEKRPDLVILDIMLPDKEGYEICKEMRSVSDVPILFLSAKNEEIDRILGFAIGADDYITKPFSPKEVAYRVKAQLRRSSRAVEPKRVSAFNAGEFFIDEDKMEVRKNGETVELKAKEYKLFVFFAKHKNQIVSKEKICENVWGEDYIGFDNTIMVHIRRLREKIEENPSKPKHIVNVKGLGYKFLV